jgi:hypothetical protein
MAQAKHLRSVSAFGHKLTQMGMEPGASYSYVIPYRMPRAQFSALQLWTKGRVRVRNAGIDMPDRTRGVLTTELNDTLEAGTLTLTAVEYAEWWCLDASRNGGVLHPVARYERPVGDHTQAQEAKLLVCDGEVSLAGQLFAAGDAVTIPAGSVISVTTDLIGLLF